MMAGTWVVGRVKPNCERRAAMNIAAQRFDYYLPYTAEVVSVGKHKMIVGRPLFARYIFVNIDGMRWQSLLSTHGLTGLIPGGGGPAVLPDGTVELLKAREDEQGLVKLPKRPEFHMGDELRIIDGPFKDRKGIYQGMSSKERVYILIDYLERKTNVLIARELVEAA